jgi:hypothetical protein
MTNLVNNNDQLLEFMDSFGSEEGIRKTSQFNGSTINIEYKGTSYQSQIVMTGIILNMMEVPGMAERGLIFEFNPPINDYTFLRMINLPNHVDSKWWKVVRFVLSKELKINCHFESTNSDDPHAGILIEPSSFEFSLNN